MTGKPKLDIAGGDVPAFTCIVYVRSVDGAVEARVANLAGIRDSAGSEREVLAKVIPAFKKRLGELLREGKAIPWIDPPEPVGEGEQKRMVPVHLKRAVASRRLIAEPRR